MDNIHLKKKFKPTATFRHRILRNNILACHRPIHITIFLHYLLATPLQCVYSLNKKSLISIDESRQILLQNDRLSTSFSVNSSIEFFQLFIAQ